MKSFRRREDIMYKNNPIFKQMSASDGSILLYDDIGNIHSLNGTAKIIFEMCSNGNDLQTICDFFRANFKCPDNIQEIVSKCIQELENKQLLEKNNR